MPTKKKENKYIGQTIEWLRMQMEQNQAYVDSRPLSALTDRKGYKTIKGQQVEYVIATIEKQREDITKAILEVGQIGLAIKALEAEEEKTKLLTRGDEELTPIESGELEEEA